MVFDLVDLVINFINIIACSVLNEKEKGNLKSKVDY